MKNQNKKIVKEFGVVQRITKDESDVIIQCNDGMTYACHDRNFVRKAFPCHRVSYTRTGTFIKNIILLPDSIEKGEILKVNSDGSGYIRTSRNEILSFQKNAFTFDSESPELGRKVQCKAISEKIDPEFIYKNSKSLMHGTASNVKVLNSEKIDSKSHQMIRKNILTEMGIGVYTLEDILTFLKRYNFTSKKYGYTDEILFLEEFTDFLRIDYNTRLVSVFDGTDTNVQEKYVRNVAKKIGYAELTKLQERTVFDPEFWCNNRILIMGTTSSGKTMIPIFKYLYEREISGKKNKMLILVPYRALAYQMTMTLREKLSKIYHLDIACSTSENLSRDMDIINGDVDIAVIIYEKLFLFLSESDSFLNRYDTITLDEISLIQEQERGIKAELIFLHVLRSNLSIILLTTPYIDWSLYIQKLNFYPIRCYHRPSRMHELFFYPKQNRYFLYDATAKPVVMENPWPFKGTLFRELRNEYELQHKIIVFTFSKLAARNRAVEIYRNLQKEFNWRNVTNIERNAFRKHFFQKYELTKEELRGVFDHDVEIDALMHGITFHTAALPETMRVAIETEFLGNSDVIPGGIHIVVATETLAYGLNSNVDTIFMTHMQKADYGGKANITYNLYQNCIGRAGRLGYGTIGRSYAFIPEQNDYQEFIRQYSWNSKTPCPIIQGKFSNILENPDANQIAFSILNLFSEQHALSLDQILTQIKNLPIKIKNIKKTTSELQNSISFLLCEKLIELSSDDFSEEKCDAYVLSKTGRKMCSAQITMKSFYKIRDAVTMISSNEDYIFDYLYKVSHCKEISKFCMNLIIRPNGSNITFENENVKKDLIAFFDLFQSMMPRLLECRVISKNMAQKIFDSSAYQKLKKFVVEDTLDSVESLDEDDFTILTYFRLAMYATLWVNGYSMGLIYDIAGYHNSSVDNARTKFGEKMSYLTDIALAIAEMNSCDKSTCILLKNLSFALFYGIRIDWLNQGRISAANLDLAKNYHIASIYSRRKQFLFEHGNTEDLDEYSYLDETTKKILSKIEGGN